MGVYRPVRALERGLAVLKAANSLATPTVDAIAKEAGLSWSTTFRMLETLEMAGYVHRQETGRTFRPTLEARTLGEGFGHDTWIAQVASPVIGRLSRRIVWPVDLMMLAADAMLIVETTHRTSPLSLDRNMIGRRLPILLTSAGRCYLAHLPSRERRSILARLARKADEEGKLARRRDTVTALLEKAREDGFGVREGGLFPHTKSIAVPILSAGKPVACISIIWISSAMSVSEGRKRYLTLLQAAAAEITTAAGPRLRRGDGRA